MSSRLTLSLPVVRKLFVMRVFLMTGKKDRMEMLTGGGVSLACDS